MAQAVITISDDNILDGTVTVDIALNETSVDDGLMTAAHIYAKFLEAGMTDPDFIRQVWAFAENLIVTTNAGGSILNDNDLIELPENEANAA